MSQELARVREDLSDITAMILPTPEMELKALQRENRELKISLYVMAGLFLLIILRARS